VVVEEMLSTTMVEVVVVMITTMEMVEENL
jgi:hypothetical protein